VPSDVERRQAPIEIAHPDFSGALRELR